jgi:hypothetical protein
MPLSDTEAVAGCLYSAVVTAITGAAAWMSLSDLFQATAAPAQASPELVCALAVVSGVGTVTSALCTAGFAAMIHR